MIPPAIVRLAERYSVRAATGLQVVDALGVSWALERIRLMGEHRLGLVERRTPLGRWESHEASGGKTRRRGVLDLKAAETFYRANPGVVDQLREHHDRLANGERNVFGKWVKPLGWHHDVVSDTFYDPSTHWSAVEEPAEADLKLVWEPSRFSWAFGLAQLHVADPTSPAAETFWRLFEDWCQNNQPNAGVNWQCGQESSLRFMAVMFATEALGASGSSESREELLRSFADVTARRVLADWRYARSQRNNHIVSEAVGLLSVAALFPELDVSPAARSTGDRLLRDACSELVFEDGGTSQYSLNYHRVFLDNFVWARAIYLLSDYPVPSELDQALDRATSFLRAVAQPEDGRAANFGHNDGAWLLPTASADQMDMRPTIAASQAVRGLPHPENELASWFRKPSSAASSVTAPKARYPQAGIALLGAGASRATVSGRNYRFRPAQSDQLHVDIWLDHVHVVVDPGTWSYKPAIDEPDLALSDFHNGPVVVGQEDMKRASRFLFLDWSQVAPGPMDGDNWRWHGERTSPATGMTARRLVEGTQGRWVITDTITLVADAQVATNWTVPTRAIQRSSQTVIAVVEQRQFRFEFESSAGDVDITARDTMVCESYRRAATGSRLTVVSGPAIEHRLVTVVSQI